MPLTIVQTTEIRATTGTSVSQTIPSPAAGNAMLIIGAQYQGTGSAATCSDNQGNTYQIVGNVQSGTAAIALGSAWLNGFLANNLATGATFTVTINWGTGTIGGTYFCVELDNQATSSLIDSPVITLQAPAFPATISKTTSNADDLLIVWFADDESGNPDSIINPASPWVTLANETNAATYQTLHSSYQAVSSTGTYSAQWTQSAPVAGSDHIGAMLIALRAGTAAVTGSATCSALASLSVAPSVRVASQFSATVSVTATSGQIALPIADVLINSWTNQVGLIPVWPALADTTDATYGQSSLAPNDSIYEAQFQALQTPGPGNQTLHVRFANDRSGGQIDYNFDLVQLPGGSIIQSWGPFSVSTNIVQQQDLSIRNAVSDWSQLAIRVTVTQVS